MSRQPLVLVIQIDATPVELGSVQRSFQGCRITHLDLRNSGEPACIPDDWRRVSVRSLLDEKALSREFLDFLERWPNQPVCRKRSFDELFRRRGGYSLWWTGPAVERVPDQGLFPIIKALWICDRAIGITAPETVLIASQDIDVTAAIGSRCARQGIRYEFLGAAPRRRDQYGRWGDGLAWLGKSLLKFLAYPVITGLRSLWARQLFRYRKDDPQHEQPTVVFTSSHQGYLEIEGEGVRVPWWDEISESLRKLAPGFRQRYLVHARNADGNSGRIAHPAWQHIVKIDSAAPIKEMFPAWRVQASEALPHLLALWRYFRLERQAAFRDSFHFAGADVSAWYLPRLRRAVQRSFRWSQEAAAIEQSLRAVGEVAAVIVAEEMYGTAMPDIAAARQLGAPVIGFQHGTIFPLHGVFTLPQGQINRAPTPDYFAVYGDYAQEVVTRYGQYPDERVWVTGMVKHEKLRRSPSDGRNARKRLGLPLDQPIALVTTQITPWYPEAVRVVLDAVRDRPDILLCIKPHPRDNRVECYERLARESGLRNVWLCNSQSYESFGQLLPACDVVLSAFSTTLLEATLLGKPSICLNFSDEPDWYPYVADGASLPASNRQEIVAALNFVLDTGNRPQWAASQEKFLRRHAMAQAGTNSSDLLATRILAVCKTPAAHETLAQIAG